MKVLTDSSPFETEIIGANTFALPQGLVGFPDYTHAELLYQQEQLPFLWMKLRGPKDSINFVVLEPGGIVKGYEPELFDADALSLELSDPAEAMVLNVVTLKHRDPVEATANLIGPIIVNRRTRIGRQLVISNYSRYSARHLLVTNEPEVARASA
jgi:flagellar assembly factor FliW